MPEDDRGPIFAIVSILFRNYEKAFFPKQYGVIGNAEWGRFERLICINGARLQAAPFDLNDILTVELRNYISDTLTKWTTGGELTCPE
jgi:hypothetical protein